jgi:hypothetical protein
MVLWARDIREIMFAGKFILQLADNIAQCGRPWAKNNCITQPFNDYLGTLESKGLGQAHRLAAPVLEKLGRRHIYSVYLHLKRSSGKYFRRSRRVQFLPDFL